MPESLSGDQQKLLRAFIATENIIEDAAFIGGDYLASRSRVDDLSIFAGLRAGRIKVTGINEMGNPKLDSYRDEEASDAELHNIAQEADADGDHIIGFTECNWVEAAREVWEKRKAAGKRDGGK